jgi:hypothetical protein
MAHIDDRIEAISEQIGIGTNRADRLHEKTPAIGAAGGASRYYLTSDPAKESLQLNRLNLISGRTTTLHDRIEKQV